MSTLWPSGPGSRVLYWYSALGVSGMLSSRGGAVKGVNGVTSARLECADPFVGVQPVAKWKNIGIRVASSALVSFGGTLTAKPHEIGQHDLFVGYDCM